MSDEIDLETVIRYIHKDMHDTKLRVDQFISEVSKERKTVKMLYENLLSSVKNIKSVVFEHITGQRMMTDSVIVSGKQFQEIVKVVEAAIGQPVMDDNKEHSTIKINRFRIVNSDWLRQTK